MTSKIATSFVVGWPRLKTRVYTWGICGLFAEFGAGSRISPPFRFANLHQVRLDREVYVSPDCWIQVIGGIGDDNSIKLDIGYRCGIGMGATISAAMSIVLEEQVLLARNVYISDHGHGYEDVCRPITELGIRGVAPVSIGRHTWLGQNVVVLPGVTIGEHCIVGANSVVRSSIPKWSVAVGAPARVVKQFNPNTGRWEKSETVFGPSR